MIISDEIPYITDPAFAFMYPQKTLAVSHGDKTKIARCLNALYGKSVAVSRSVIPDTLEQWGKVRLIGGGDTMHARELVKVQGYSRDASYVRVSQALYSEWCLYTETLFIV